MWHSRASVHGRRHYGWDAQIHSSIPHCARRRGRIACRDLTKHSPPRRSNLRQSIRGGPRSRTIQVARSLLHQDGVLLGSAAMRGFSFEIRADAKLGRRAQTGRQRLSPSAPPAQDATGLQRCGSTISDAWRRLTKNATWPSTPVSTGNPNQLRGCLQKKLSWGAYMRRDRIRLEQTQVLAISFKKFR